MLSGELFEFLLVTGGCHRRLKSLANYLRENKNVRTVGHLVEVPEMTDAFRVEEYVDAEPRVIIVLL